MSKINYGSELDFRIRTKQLLGYITYLDSRDLVKAVSKNLDEFIEKIINKHVWDAIQGQYRDFIDLMLSLNDSDNTQDEQSAKMDRTNIQSSWT